MKLSLFSLLIAVSIFAEKIYGSETRVYVALLPGLFHSKGDGAYDKVFQEIKRRTKTSFKIERFPPARARLNFEKDLNSCLAPANKEEYLNDPGIIESHPFNYARVHAFTLNNKPKINALDELNGKVLGKVRGLRIDLLDSLFNKRLTEVDKNEQLITMLMAGRIDVIVDFAPDIFYSLNKQPKAKEKIHYNVGFKLRHANNSLVCHHNPKSNLFGEVNQAIRELRKEGRMKILLGPMSLL